MNVILEISVPDVVEVLADHKTDQAFVKSMQEAKKEEETSQSDFISLFINAYHRNAPGHRLAEIFATQQLKGKVSTQSTDKEVEKALRDEVQTAIDNSFNVVRNRIDKFGVVQPNIQKLEGQQGRIMVEMPGIREPERIRKLLQGSANLEFWETYNSQEITSYFSQLDQRLLANNPETAADSAAVAKEDTVKADAPKLDIKANKTVDAATDEAKIAELKKQHPLLAMMSLAPQGSLSVVAYANVRDTAEINKYIYSELAQQIFPSDLKLCWGATPSDMVNSKNVYELYALKKTGTNGRAPLEGDVIVDAKDEFDHVTGRPCVSMSMNSDGARRWATLTKANVGKAIAIVLDDAVYSAPRVNGEISGGNSQITGNFTVETTKDLANTLKSGRMPAPARIVQEEVVGPTLGAQSIQQGIMSFIVAFILLMIYMVMMYGFIPGMMANFALIVNLFFTLGILTSFQAALTMSGLAGIVLTLGTAVDANVLIYERIKEEMRNGKGIKEALKAGYSNAFSAIFDSNLTSLITGIILLYFGTGAAVVVFLISFFVRGLSKSIDFTGGRNYVVTFEKSVQPEEIRGLLVQAFPGCNTGAISIGTDNKTIRISTNYKIESNSPTADDEAETILYTALKKAGLVSQADVESFKNPDVREGGSIISSTKVGPSVAKDITYGAIISVLIALVAIFLYILFRFRNVAFSVGSIVALAVDTLVVLGLYSLLWGIVPWSLEIDQTFIGAILTVIGYSINDKVVVFDRIRENLGLHPKQDKQSLFNESINQTLARTVNTSISTLLVLLCIFILGGASIRSFAFAMILGVIFGTLSSIFIASPVAYLVMGRKIKEDDVVKA